MGLRELGSEMSAYVKTTFCADPDADGESWANAAFIKSIEAITVAESAVNISRLVRRVLLSRIMPSPFPGPALSYERVASPGRSVAPQSARRAASSRWRQSQQPGGGLYSMRRPRADS